MPAKKKTTEEEEAKASTTAKKTTTRKSKKDDEAEEKPKRTTRSRAKKTDEDVEEKPKRTARSRAKKADDEAEEKPKRTARSRAKKSEDAEEEKPKRTTRSRAKKTEEPEEEAKPKRTARSRTKKAEDEPEEKPKRATSSRTKKADDEAEEKPKRTARSRTKKAEETEEKPKRTTRSRAKESDDEPEAKPKRATRSRTKKAEAKVAEIEPIISWRSRKDEEKPKKETRSREREPERDEERPEPQPRRRGSRGRGRKSPEVTNRPAPERVKIPLNAAQVIMHEQRPTLIKNGRALAPLSFFGGTLSQESLATVLDELKMAAQYGVEIFSTLVELPCHPDHAAKAAGIAGFLMQEASKIAPDIEVIFRTVLIAPKGWQKDFPDARYEGRDGETAEPSLFDPKYWQQAEETLEDYVAMLRKLPDSDRILGVHLERGEWFFPQHQGYDTSNAATKAFNEWLRHRYRDDIVSLRAAWFDGKAQFGRIDIPEPVKEEETPFVLTDRRERKHVDCHLFLSDMVYDRIASLAHTVKKASEGWFLVSVSYGYTFEWAHPSSGHLSLGKLLRCPDVDCIAGPPSYRDREPGGSAAMPAPVDSFALNGKVFISEEDFKTPISGSKEHDDFNPVMRTPQSLESVHWRGAGAALTHSSALCWMDSWGSGWLSSPGIWSRAESIRKALEWTRELEPTAPDVAMLIDERGLAYLADENAFKKLVQQTREAMLRSGLSVGFYLLSDLAHREHFPESKVYAFVNAWDLRPEVRSAIKTRLQRDNKVLFWLYATGIFEGGRESLERAREVTGIALRPQPFAAETGTTILNPRDPLSASLPADQLAQGDQLRPSYFAIPEDAQVLGEYTQNGLPSFVVRQFDDGEPDTHWTSVFLGEPVVTPALIRSLGQMAGAHVWGHADDVIHARPPFLCVHCGERGPRTITLPTNWTAYDLVDQEWCDVEGASLKFSALEGSTHLFVVGVRAEVEAILDSSPVVELTEDEILSRREDSVHWDAIQFDVPVMRLDEWVEESWSEGMADDLLLKPSQIDADSSESRSSRAVQPEGEPSSRRRRRRRRRRGSEESSDRRREGAEREGNDDLGVMFRKRG